MRHKTADTKQGAPLCEQTGSYYIKKKVLDMNKTTCVFILDK